MALHGHVIHVSSTHARSRMRTPGWFSAYVVKVLYGNGDVVFNRLCMMGLRMGPPTRSFVPFATEVLLYTTCRILEIIHIQLLKPSFER